MNDPKDSLVYASDTPDISEIIKDYQSCGTGGDYFSQTQTADDTRLNYWAGQSDDGRKHASQLTNGKEPFPWEGASDVRCFQADGVVNELVAMDLIAFWRSELRLKPIGVEDAEDSGAADKYMDWLKNVRLRKELAVESELSSQFRHTYGWGVLHVSWKREVGIKKRPVTMEELIALAKQVQSQPNMPPEYAETASLLAVLPDLIARPDNEKQAMEVLKMLYRQYAKQTLSEVLSDDDIPELSNKRARNAIRELRDDGKTKLPTPYLCKNQPQIRALKPWRDIVVRNYSCYLQDHPRIFLPVYMSEVDFRSMAQADGWDKDWVELAVKTKGKQTNWNETRDVQTNTTQLQWEPIDAKTELIEVVTMLSRQIDDEYGATCIYQTVFSPHVSGKPEEKGGTYGKHEHFDVPRNEYPVYQYSRELLDRTLSASRGVPQILMTSQRTEKVQHDSLNDLTSISVVPPLLLSKQQMGGRFRFGPALQNQVTFGQEPKVMDIPTKGMVPAVEYLDIIESKYLRYFGLFHEKNPVALSQMLNEPSVKRFLAAWGEAFYMAYLMSCKYCPDVVERVTGFPVKNPDDVDDLEHDVALGFDVTILDPDSFANKMKMFSELIPEDSEGVMDKAKLVEIKARMIDPAIARELITSTATATEQIKKSVRSDFVEMFAGNPPNIRDASNDPTAPSKLQYAQQVLMSNPKYIGALDREMFAGLFQQIPPQILQQIEQAGMQPDVLFSRSVEQYMQNLTQGAEQQANKVRGRTGV